MGAGYHLYLFYFAVNVLFKVIFVSLKKPLYPGVCDLLVKFMIVFIVRAVAFIITLLLLLICYLVS